MAGCWQTDYGPLTGREAAVTTVADVIPDAEATVRCVLEVGEPARTLLVNCFQIDGVLHIHSNRLARMPRLVGESWVDAVRRRPAVRVEIDGLIHSLTATPIDDEARRRAILHDRGYWIAWDGITVFRFLPQAR
jgi:hypothetical protein